MALFSIGFRPFYLLAALFAALAVPLWALALAGFDVDGRYLSGAAWHAHEMVFGFAAAVLAGFLLTAVQNWTGRATPSGLALILLSALWLAGRLLVFTGPAFAAALVDLAFLPVLMVVLGRLILLSKNYRNIVLPVILALLFAANLIFHLEIAGYVAFDENFVGIRLALYVFALLITVMAGRVVPAFTRNAVSDARSRTVRPIEYGAFGTLLLLIALEGVSVFYAIDGRLIAGVAILGVLAHAARLWCWNPGATRHQPLLWILPLSYAWLPVFFMLRALVALDVAIPPALPFHALSIGAMGGLMIGMMVRSARGHTGQTLIADPSETGAFLLVHIACVCRVFLPLAMPESSDLWHTASAACWSAAFAIVLIKLWRPLTQPRLDSVPA